MGLRSPRSQQLQSLAAAVPGQQQEQVQQAQAAQTMQVQQAFGFGQRQPGQTPTQGQLQQMGAQMTQAAGQAQLQAQEQGAKTLAAQGQGILEAKQQQRQNMLQQKSLQLGDKEIELRKKLYGISKEKGNELWAAQLKFQKDELGRTLFNERQLADWAMTKARSLEDLRNYEQQVSLLSERRMKMLEVAERKIQAELQNQWSLAEIQRDGQFQLELKKKLHNIKLKIQRERAAAASRAARSSAIGGLFGMAVGGALVFASGGTAAPLVLAGMSGGGAIGGGLGTLAAD